MTSRAIAAVLLIGAILLASHSSAHLWLGREGLGMGKLGAAGSQGSNGVAPTATCSSGSLMNGVFDLTNTCNDIYIIGALK